MKEERDNRSSLPEFSIIIPCYNEEKSILSTIQEIQNNLSDKQNYEIIIINDGSTDGTEKILTSAEENLNLVHIITHTKNRGYGAAIKTGIQRTKSDLIVITDADGTYPNERIPELVNLAKDADMVVGARIGDDVHYPFIRKVPKLFLRMYASWLAGQNIPDINSGLRVFKRSVAEKFMHILPNGFSLTTTITLAMLINYKDVQYVPISYKKRVGKSKIRPIRDTLQFIQLIVRTAMYFAPLRVLTPVIIFMACTFVISIGYDIFVLDNITEKSLILLMFTGNTVLFALLADMIDKRSS